MNFVSTVDIRRKLHHSVIQVGSDWFLANQNGDDGNLLNLTPVFDIKTPKPISANDERINLLSSPIGCTTIPTGSSFKAIYPKRHPFRQWRYGLYTRNYSFIQNPVIPPFQFGQENLTVWRYLIRPSRFSVGDAFKLVRNKRCGIAISANSILDRPMKSEQLYFVYKGFNLGLVSEVDKATILRSVYSDKDFVAKLRKENPDMTFIPTAQEDY